MIQKYNPQGTCSTEIHFDVADGVVQMVRFINGCEGNLSGIGQLVVGMKVEDVVSKLKGIPCGGRDTSCPDQLARALETWLDSK
jgi:uncharacterized protein (TIGR03905 family)